MTPEHCKNCKHYRTLVEVRRSAQGLETTDYCDPLKVWKSGPLTPGDREMLIDPADRADNSPCRHYEPKWHIRLIHCIRRRFGKDLQS